MSKRLPCKECPWVVKSRNNTSITNHANKHNKIHGCHMIDDQTRGPLWEPNEGCECIGAKENIKKDGSTL